MWSLLDIVSLFRCRSLKHILRWIPLMNASSNASKKLERQKLKNKLNASRKNLLKKGWVLGLSMIQKSACLVLISRLTKAQEWTRRWSKCKTILLAMVAHLRKWAQPLSKRLKVRAPPCLEALRLRLSNLELANLLEVVNVKQCNLVKQRKSHQCSSRENLELTRRYKSYFALWLCDLVKE